jgi:glycosyltransferase involved in cell wall biosynthesis
MRTYPSVLMYCSRFRPAIGGAERQAERLSHALIRGGCTVEVLTPRFDPTSLEVEQVGELVVRRFPLADLSERFPNRRGFGPANALSLLYQTFRAVREHIDRFDIVHVHLASAQVPAVLRAAHQKGKRVLCKVASTGTMFDLEMVKRTSLLGPVAARRIRNGVDHWIATSSAVGAELRSRGIPESRIHQIPNGVDLDLLSRESASSVARRFLYLGRLATTANRDIPTLLAAFDRLAGMLPEVELVVVGGGDLLSSVRDLVSRMEHSSRVRVPGFGDSAEWLRWADCFVLPSRVEGLSNALLEAMGSGIACIANDIPPNREALDDGRAGILVPVGDEPGLLSALRRVATHQGEVNLLGRAARRRAEMRYSLDAVAAAHLELYHTSLASSDHLLARGIGL